MTQPQIFLVPGIPHGKGSIRSRVVQQPGKKPFALHYPDKATKEYMKLVTDTAVAAGVTLHERVRIYSLIVLPCKVVEYKTKKHLVCEPLSHCDTDNLQKSIFDGLQGIAFANDKHVLSQTSEFKFMVDVEPGVLVHVIPVVWTDYLNKSNIPNFDEIYEVQP